MARVLIIGASRGLGLEAVRQALDAGNRVSGDARASADVTIEDRSCLRKAPMLV
jgi:NAD(P)-dependent dehydrogenase (short-subunit alcohol dehydrogenase family)